MNKNLFNFILGSLFSFGFLYSKNILLFHVLSSAALLFFLYQYIIACPDKQQLSVKLFTRHEILNLCILIACELGVQCIAPIAILRFLKRLGGLMILVGISGFSLSLDYLVKQRKVGTSFLRSGPYAYIRHPVYLSLLLYLFGVFVYLSVWLTAVVTLLYINRVIINRVRAEEAQIVKVAPEYGEYMITVYSGVLWHKI